jgi:hypothetical protein
MALLLEVAPLYVSPQYCFEKEDVEVTNALYHLLIQVTTNQKALAEQVRALMASDGLQPIWMFTGNQIDRRFKAEVERLQFQRKLPSEILIAKNGTSPDLSWKGIGWDITTAEQGRHHYRRDVLPDSQRWDAYFVLAY